MLDSSGQETNRVAAKRKVPKIAFAYALPHNKFTPYTEQERERERQ